MTEREIQRSFFIHNQTRFTTIIPNCYPPRWLECDLLAITVASYMYEFEIKLSRSDFLNDANKGLSFGHTKEYYESLGIDLAGTKYERLMEGDKSGPSKFWYIVPEILLSTIEIPTFAGCLCAVRRGRFIFFKEEKKAPRLHKNKLSEEIKDNLMHKLCFRYWRERNRNYERFLAEAGKGE